MRAKYFLFVHHTTSIFAKLSTWCFEHSGDISCSLLVNPSHTDEYWEGRNTCMWIYIYIYIFIIYKNVCEDLQNMTGYPRLSKSVSVYPKHLPLRQTGNLYANLPKIAQSFIA